jgi:hypothetical protein
MTKIAGSGSASGSISQKHGSADPDPDPHQNVMDPQHCLKWYSLISKRYHVPWRTVENLGATSPGFDPSIVRYSEGWQTTMNSVQDTEQASDHSVRYG